MLQCPGRLWSVICNALKDSHQTFEGVGGFFLHQLKPAEEYAVQWIYNGVPTVLIGFAPRSELAPEEGLLYATQVVFQGGWRRWKEPILTQWWARAPIGRGVTPQEEHCSH